MLYAQAWRPTVTPLPLAAVKQRVPDPFERLFLQEYPKVVAIAYRVLADRPAAEDVAQEVFLKFHRSLSPDSERASGWLHAAAVHSALNVIRGERRRAQRETAHARDAAQASIASPEGIVEEGERRREVRSALARLPQRTAAVLLLRHSGLSYAEVASALGMKVGNVGTVLRRAEEALRKEVNRAPSE
ncbi:MAG TPA: sigma-70 family RNA polymerase sigma factor [Candidatus Dormibacteraeota bacterium]|nr:sigma-70 family RNA polymerase sigma factor [Candidatus Dormibacteraeota bacterium]